MEGDFIWDIQILGTEFYFIINWFYIYSFLGWCFESTYVSVKNGKLINRGFVNGPLCTIYGAGAVTVYLLLRPISSNVYLLYICGVIVPTVLEYVTAVIMEMIFHTSWWDYSSKKFNFHGKICLGSSLVWGFMTILLFSVLQPIVDGIVTFYPVYFGKIIVIIITIVYIIDFTVSSIGAANLSMRIEKMYTVMEEFTNTSIIEKLSGGANEIKEKMETVVAQSLNMEELKTNFDEKFENLFDTLGLQELNDAKKEFSDKVKEYYKKYSSLLKKKNFVHIRFISAYPNMKLKNGNMQMHLNKLKEMIKRKG